LYMWWNGDRITPILPL